MIVLEFDDFFSVLILLSKNKEIENFRVGRWRRANENNNNTTTLVKFVTDQWNYAINGRAVISFKMIVFSFSFAFSFEKYFWGKRKSFSFHLSPLTLEDSQSSHETRIFPMGWRDDALVGLSNLSYFSFSSEFYTIDEVDDYQRKYKIYLHKIRNANLWMDRDRSKNHIEFHFIFRRVWSFFCACDHDERILI